MSSTDILLRCITIFLVQLDTLNAPSRDRNTNNFTQGCCVPLKNFALCEWQPFIPSPKCSNPRIAWLFGWFLDFMA